jgi:transporter family protein
VRALDRQALLFLVLSGLAGAGPWLCYFRSLQLGDAVRVAPIDRLGGAVTPVLAAQLPHERAPISAWIGTAVMVVGAVIVARS